MTLPELAYDRAKWLPILRELLANGLIEFGRRSWDLPGWPPAMPSDDAIRTLERPDEWQPRRTTCVGFWTTDRGERALTYWAYHFKDGAFVDLREDED